MTARKIVKKPARRKPVNQGNKVAEAISAHPWGQAAEVQTEYIQPRTKREKLLWEQAYYRGEKYGREVGQKQQAAEQYQRAQTDAKQAKVRLIQAVGQTLNTQSEMLGNLARVLGN